MDHMLNGEVHIHLNDKLIILSNTFMKKSSVWAKCFSWHIGEKYTLTSEKQVTGERLFSLGKVILLETQIDHINIIHTFSFTAIACTFIS